MPVSEQPRYLALMALCRRLLSSPLTLLVILALTYGVSIWLSERVYPSTISTWAAPITDAGRKLSLAGWWRALQERLTAGDLVEVLPYHPHRVRVASSI